MMAKGREWHALRSIVDDAIEMLLSHLGPEARPMHPDWVRHLRDQCQAHLYARMREIGITAKAFERAYGQDQQGRQMVLDLFDEAQ